MTELPRRRVADDAYAELRRLLTDHEYGPGTRLLVDDLAQRFGVSPTPIREALARLVTDGLVRKRPRQGYVVSPLLDRDAVEELYLVRMRFEPWAAARAARGWVGEDLRRLAEIQESVPSEPDLMPYAEYQELSRLDDLFHGEVLRLSGVRLLSEVVERLLPVAHLFHAFRQPGACEQAWKEHRTVFEAIGARQADEAERAMTSHLERALDRILAQTSTDKAAD